MKPITQIREIQSILYDALTCFRTVCEQHGLTYFLSNGSLLGAVKYGDFIPWDDDADILMPREDYEKLTELFYEEGHYRLFCEKNSPNWRLPYSKLSDTRTKCLEQGWTFGEEIGLSLDIFPIDSWHPVKWVANCQAGYMELLKRFLICTNAEGFFTEKKGIKRFILYGIHTAANWLGHKRVKQMIQNRIQKAQKYPPRYVGCVCWCCYGKGEIIPADVFWESVPVTLRGCEFSAPKGYEAYLTGLYGDWRRELPPEEQKSNHKIEVYTKL
ncbi:MAG: LicD family protein [Clostridia bacterium]|nr:LicD family protein [Clostridia bacterium]